MITPETGQSASEVDYPPPARPHTRITGGGFDQFRVTVKCTHAGSQYTNYGAWVTVDRASTAACDYGDLLATASSNPTASVFHQLD